MYKWRIWNLKRETNYALMKKMKMQSSYEFRWLCSNLINVRVHHTVLYTFDYTSPSTTSISNYISQIKSLPLISTLTYVNILYQLHIKKESVQKYVCVPRKCFCFFFEISALCHLSLILHISWYNQEC